MKKIIFMSIVVCFGLFLLVNCGKNLEYERGTIKENRYESKYLNINFCLPEGFVLASEQDMLEIMNIDTETTDINDLKNEIAKLKTVYEMMSAAPMGFPSVSLIVEKLESNKITTEQYVEALKQTLLSVETFDYIIGNQITSIKIAGKNYKQFSASVPNLRVIQKYIFRKQGSRMISFVVTYTPFTEEETETLMNGFSKLK